MSADEKNCSAPRRWVRLLIWFGIYAAAQLPFIPWVWPEIERRNPVVLLFPQAMEWGILIVSWYLGFDQNKIPVSLQGLVGWLFVISPWAIYVTHLVLMVWARNRKTFLILIWVFIGIVAFNMASCAMFLHNPPE
jgi:hypothetical protein